VQSHDAVPPILVTPVASGGGDAARSPLTSVSIGVNAVRLAGSAGEDGPASHAEVTLASAGLEPTSADLARLESVGTESQTTPPGRAEAKRPPAEPRVGIEPKPQQGQRVAPDRLTTSSADWEDFAAEDPAQAWRLLNDTTGMLSGTGLDDIDGRVIRAYAALTPQERARNTRDIVQFLHNHVVAGRSYVGPRGGSRRPADTNHPSGLRSQWSPLAAHGNAAAGPSNHGGSHGPTLAAVPSPADLRTAYQMIAPGLSHFVVRAQGLPEDEINDTDIAAFARTPDGERTNGAIGLYLRDAQWNFGITWRAVMDHAGVTVEHVSNRALARLVSRNPAYDANFPELQTFLHHREGQLALTRTVHNVAPTRDEVTHEGVRVTFSHSWPGDPLALPRRELTLRALSMLRAGGYTLPLALDVRLPRYHRGLVVRPISRNGQAALAIETSSVDDDLDDVTQAMYSAPNVMVVTPLAVAPRRLGDAHPEPYGVDHLMEDPGLGVLLHEMMHWLHFQNRPSAFADLDETKVRDYYLESVAAVTEYALVDPHEFVAEYGVGRLLGRRYDPVVAARLDELYRGLGGPLPIQPTGPLAPPPPSDAQLTYLVHAVHRMPGLSRASPHDVAMVEATLPVFDRWRSLTARAQLIAATLANQPRLAMST
jgi:hypothetical protein